MLKRTSTILSYLFYPLLIPFYTFIWILNDNGYYSARITPQGKWIIMGLLFGTLVLFPFLISLFLYKKNMVKSLFLENREERVYPLLIVAIFYYLTYYLLKGLHISSAFSYFMLGLTFQVLCALVITFFHKISLYMVAMGSVIGLLFGIHLGHGVDQSIPIMTALFVTGVLATVRLNEKSHNAMEIYSGLVLGIAVTFSLFYFV